MKVSQQEQQLNLRDPLEIIISWISMKYADRLSKHKQSDMVSNLLWSIHSLDVTAVPADNKNKSSMVHRA